MTYSSTVAFGRQQVAMRNQNSVSFRPRDKRLGPVSNSVVLIVLACLLGLLYLTQVTKTNAYGYTINNLEQEKTSLQSKHDDLAVASARLRALDRVRVSAEAKAMTSVAPVASVR
jgi:hypothetical protein